MAIHAPIGGSVLIELEERGDFWRSLAPTLDATSPKTHDLTFNHN
jgi:hypothetical protein